MDILYGVWIMPQQSFIFKEIKRKQNMKSNTCWLPQVEVNGMGDVGRMRPASENHGPIQRQVR